MKITLISSQARAEDQGIRTISSELKKAGYKVDMVFMTGNDNYSKLYSIKILNQLRELCKDSNLIGINAYASTSKRAIQIINFLKPMQIPIIFGGVHATISPEKCIEHCDIVCVGEGEEAVVELAEKLEKKKSIDKIKNLWIKRIDKNGNKTIIKNPVRSLINDIDKIAPPDYDFETHYILDKDKIRKFRSNNLGGRMFFLSGRGCPHSCTYCTNSVLNELYKEKRKNILRWHSVDYTIKVLLDIKNKFPNSTGFAMEDDTFLYRPIEQIITFCKEFKEKINLPFKIETDPRSVTEEKIKLITDAGCVNIMIGIQGSERTNREIYHRLIKDEEIINASKILSKFSDKLLVNYDVITCNPYEESDEIINLINLLRRLHKPYRLSVCNLIFFPGSKLYQRAIKDGTIKTEKDAANDLVYGDRSKHILLRKKNVYLNLILNLMKGFATEKKYGMLSNSTLNFLLKEKKVKWYTEHQFIPIIATRILGVIDFMKAILKTFYRKFPVSWRQYYLKLRYKDKIVNTAMEV